MSLTNGHANAHANAHANGYANDTTPSYITPTSDSLDKDFLNEHSVTSRSAVNGENSSNRFSKDKTMPIAIIGLACRFSGENEDSSSPEKLWDMLEKGQSGWSKGFGERFNQDSFYHPVQENDGTSNVQGAHTLKQDLSVFDAPFFGISPIEAKAMDPSQRIQLEVTYEAIENAGIPITKLAGSDTSVFVATFNQDYNRILNRDPDFTPKYQVTGNGSAILANRVSYFFDLKGVSFIVDTGCSGSMVALNQACQSIYSGESKQAIVGGSNIILDPVVQAGMSNLGFFSDSGRCYSFDERASGYGRGEGMACMILKPLDDALADGDAIRAVIRSCVANSDGKTNGLTVPSQTAQEDLIRTAYDRAGLDPRETAYFEAHGTGTRVGDPIEAGAIASTLGKCRDASNPILIGSVKTNLGHTESTSGLAGVFKGVLMLEKGLIPASLNFEKPNESIPLADWNLKVASTTQPWPADCARRVSVNSFGYGGTNAHCILEGLDYYLSHRQQSNSDSRPVNGHANAPPQDGANEGSPKRVFALSSAVKKSTLSMAKNLGQYVSTRQPSQTATLLRDLAHTLSSRRAVLSWRLAVTASDLEDLVQELSQPDLKPLFAAPNINIGFIFTGQGAQWPGMGRELIKAYPIFKESLEAAEMHFKSLGAQWSLIDELLQPKETSRINTAAISQPLCTAIQNALVNLFVSWNIRPTAVVGHSSGEISAAYSAGAIDFKSALTIAYYRGFFASKMKKRLPHLKGAMLAVGLSEEETQAQIAQIPEDVGKVVIACVNSPTNLTVSGDRRAVLRLQSALEVRQTFVRRLDVEMAYHSHHMKSIAGEYLAALAETSPPRSDLSSAFISSVTGGKIAGDRLTPSYWVENLLSRVRFSEALAELCQDLKAKCPATCLVEVGPHSAMASSVKQILTANSLSRANIKYVPSLIREKDGIQAVCNLAGDLFVKGISVNLDAVNFPTADEKRKVLVDLEPYPWNHTVQHWHESRQSINFRKRQHPRHHLLGAPVTDYNPLEPSWHNYLRVAENPWLRGHVVQNNIIFPATGYLSMGLEAARQKFIAKGTNDRIVYFKLRNITLGRAITIPDTVGGVETSCTLRPFNTSARFPSEIWDEFLVFSYSESRQATEHCRGLISVGIASKAEDVEGQNEEAHRLHHCNERVMQARELCTTPMEAQALYGVLDEAGITYAHPFNCITDLVADPDQAVATISVPDTAAVMPGGYEQPYVIHPATLDLCIQAVFAALYKAHGMEDPALPVGIDELFISNTVDQTPGDQLHSYATTTRSSLRDYHADVSVWGIDENGVATPVAELHNLMSTSLGSGTGVQKPSDRRDISWTMQWKLDVELNDYETVKSSCLRALPAGSGAERRAAYQVALKHYIRKALDQLSEDHRQSMKPHHQKYFDWMKKQDIRQNLNMSEINAHIDHAKNSGDEGKLLCHIGENLFHMLTGEVETLEVMMSQDLLYGSYKNDNMNRCYATAAAYANLLGFKRPDLNVLEVGGGTTGATTEILKSLSNPERGSNRPHLFNHYDFTDISSGFFEKAEILLEDWKGLVDFKKFDVESPPEAQGFKEGSYDLIVASNVLHATANIDNTLRNTRSLLKAGGKLILIEETQPAETCFIYGPLPGWWLGADDGRVDSPLMSADRWDEHLAKTGFSGVDILMQDYPSEQGGRTSTLVATAIEASVELDASRLEIIGTSSSTACPELDQDSLVLLAEALKTTASGTTLEDIKVQEKTYVCLLEGAGSLLRHCTDTQFEAIKQILSKSEGILWVTRGASMECTDPESSLISGLARTSRCENQGTRLVTLDLDPKRDLLHEKSREIIARVVQYSLNFAVQGPRDLEFAERDGQIFIPRLQEDRACNQWLNDFTSTPDPQLQPFYQKDRAFRLEVAQPGLMDSLRFIDHPITEEDLKPDDVRVEARAFGINFRDIMISLGQIGGGKGFIGETSGVVVKSGTNMTDRFRVGDRVCGFTDQAYASYFHVSGRVLQHFPEDMSFEEAASLPISHTTAYFSLVDRARLKKGESVLIHSAAGGFGQASIMLSQHLGAQVFVTVGTKEKKQFLMENYNIPETHIFSSRRFNFVQGIKKMTNGRGVDIVLNSLAGEGLTETLKVIAQFGRFIELGKRDATIKSRMDMGIFLDGISYIPADLDLLSKVNLPFFEEMTRRTFDLIRANTVRAVKPITVFPVTEFEQAFRQLQKGMHIGKLVLTCSSDAEVKVLPQKTAPTNFREDASYLICGGLGGIGRVLCRWMASSNVKNIIALSRSGLESEGAKELVAELEEQGVRLATPRCDIGNAEQVQAAIKECERSMPPIRGIIQSALKLKDTVLDNMSAADFHAVMGAKVDGSYNILNAVSKASLDWCIMLSSGAGIIGNHGQGNYAAASTFQDALARHRTANGMKTISLDLGIIADAGYAADHHDAMKFLFDQGFTTVKLDELIALINYAISTPVASNDTSQLITGFAALDANKPESELPVSLLDAKFFQVRYGASGSSGASSSSDGGDTVDVRKALERVTDLAAAGLVVRDALIAKISRVLATAAEDINPERTIASYGADSLVAVELKNWITRELEANVPILEILSSKTINAVADEIAARSKLVAFKTEMVEENEDKEVGTVAKLTDGHANGTANGTIKV